MIKKAYFLKTEHYCIGSPKNFGHLDESGQRSALFAARGIIALDKRSLIGQNIAIVYCPLNRARDEAEIIQKFIKDLKIANEVDCFEAEWLRYAAIDEEPEYAQSEMGIEGIDRLANSKQNDYGRKYQFVITIAELQPIRKLTEIFVDSYCDLDTSGYGAEFELYSLPYNTAGFAVSLKKIDKDETDNNFVHYTDVDD